MPVGGAEVAVRGRTKNAPDRVHLLTGPTRVSLTKDADPGRNRQSVGCTLASASRSGGR